MGRRSRKRARDDQPHAGAVVEREPTTRAERDAARRERRASAAPRRRPVRPTADDRPPAPWGTFPLGELVVLLGLLLIGWGFFTYDDDGGRRVAAGLVVASLAGLELSVREHLAGFRSHTTLLAGVTAFAVVTGLALGPGPHVLGWLVLIAAVVFGSAFYGLRRAFVARSGGVAYR
jgi:hypothetical protein